MNLLPLPEHTAQLEHGKVHGNEYHPYDARHQKDKDGVERCGDDLGTVLELVAVLFVELLEDKLRSVGFLGHF